jgi:imidazolonepropionase-like amidohydrolase
MMTTSVLFTNVRIIDGTGAQPFSGEVLVQGNRISRMGRGPRSLPTAGVTVIDGAGATLMPGMVEAHTHFSWNDAAKLLAVMKDGVFYKEPEIRSTQTRWGRSVA